MKKPSPIKVLGLQKTHDHNRGWQRLLRDKIILSFMDKGLTYSINASALVLEANLSLK